MTKYEKAIYDIVATSHEHLTVSQVYERLKEICPKVVPATVYNNLNKLWDSGLIRKHDHLVCRHCGKIMDISFEDLTAPLRSQLGEDFLFYDLKVYYLCPECRAAKGQKAK